MSPLKLHFAATFLFCAAVATAATAQEPPPPGDPKYVPRQEYEKVVHRLDTVTSELEQVKNRQAAAGSVNASAKDTDAALEEVRQTVHDIQDQLHSVQPGTHQFLVTGYGFAMFEDHRGGPSTFSAGVNPLFLLKITDRLIFECEFEVQFKFNADGERNHLNIEIGNIS